MTLTQNREAMFQAKEKEEDNDQPRVVLSKVSEKLLAGRQSI